jgi:hypothetical protein
MRVPLIPALGIALTVGAVGGVLAVQHPRLFQREDPAVPACEAGVKKLIRSPASFQLADSYILENEVNLSFDAQNGFGALLRGSATCRFKLEYGKGRDMAGNFTPDAITIDGEPVNDTSLLLAQVEAVIALGHGIAPGDTKLTAEPQDLATSECVRRVWEKAGRPTVPPSHVGARVATEGKQSVVLVFDTGSPPGLPSRSSCPLGADWRVGEPRVDPG